MSNHLSPDGQYICPVCRHGQISRLALMDAFACSFCRHIFDIAYAEQLVRTVDESQPVSWQWLGDRWATLGKRAATPAVWAISLILALVPSSLVGLATYMFPPLPGSRWAWFPEAWSLGALLCHGLLGLWIVVEHHQPPLYAANKVRLSRLLQRS